MTSQKKCSYCLYDEVCDHKAEPGATDCCILEADLRDKQKAAFKAGGVSMFASVTATYIALAKDKSKYWLSKKK